MQKLILGCFKVISELPTSFPTDLLPLYQASCSFCNWKKKWINIIGSFTVFWKLFSNSVFYSLMVLPYSTCQTSCAYFIFPLVIDTILKSALYFSYLCQHITECCLASSLYTNLNVNISAWAVMAGCSWVTSSCSSLFWTLPVHLISRNGYKVKTRDHEASEQGNGHNHLRERNLKYLWKTNGMLFINGISKQSMGRALLPLFSPAEDTPALGRAQSPACIRLRQVTALSYKNLLCTMAFPDHLGRRDIKQGGE